MRPGEHKVSTTFVIDSYRPKMLVFKKSLRNFPFGSYFVASWMKSSSLSYLDRSTDGDSVNSLPQ